MTRSNVGGQEEENGRISRYLVTKITGQMSILAIPNAVVINRGSA